MDMKVTYGEKFYSDMNDSNLSSARAVVPIVLDLVENTSSVIDIGSGRGLWLKAFLENGVESVYGVDGSWVEEKDLVVPTECFSSMELDKEFVVNKEANLAISLEVAEHVPESSAEHFINQLTKTAPIVLFSAAIPGQGGTNHLNEQWPSYWEEKFKARGYIAVDAIRRKIWSNKDIAFFYSQNMFFFVKETELQNYPKLKSEFEAGFDKCDSLVHPVLFERTNEDAKRWKLIVPYMKYVPVSFLKQIKKFMSKN